MWQPFDEGKSIGSIGSESGAILRDEEHSDGARITLERGGVTAPFSITCGVYGWFVHTVFAGSELEALASYDPMKVRLADMASRTDEIHDEIHEFVRQFP